jgi:hypothetical protein
MDNVDITNNENRYSTLTDVSNDKLSKHTHKQNQMSFLSCVRSLHVFISLARAHTHNTHNRHPHKTFHTNKHTEKHTQEASEWRTTVGGFRLGL